MDQWWVYYGHTLRAVSGQQENANGIGPWSLPSEITETKIVEYGT